MKIVFPFIMLVTFSVLGQGFDYPQGAYKSFEEIKQKSPSVAVELSIEKRTKGDIKMNGGNDYRPFAEDESVIKPQ